MCMPLNRTFLPFWFEDSLQKKHIAFDIIAVVLTKNSPDNE